MKKIVNFFVNIYETIAGEIWLFKICVESEIERKRLGRK